MPAGRLDRRIRFDCRLAVDDGFGNTVSGDWVDQFTRSAGLAYLRGGEGVLAGRLTGRQPAILTVRNSAMARRITTEWRAVDTGSGEMFNIRENPKPTEDRAYCEMLVEGGVAV